MNSVFHWSHIELWPASLKKFNFGTKLTMKIDRGCYSLDLSVAFALKFRFFTAKDSAGNYYIVP